MFSSEIIKNKSPRLFSNSINLLPGLLIRHGSSKYRITNMLFLLLTYIKASAAINKVSKVSTYEKFLTFLNYFTPRVNLIEIKRKPKSIYIPLPPENNETILRLKFLNEFLKVATASYSWDSYAKRLFLVYKNSFKKSDQLNKNIDFLYSTSKQNKWRAGIAYKAKHKLNKKQNNVIKKSKQFYL
jgi:hypothetical protein